MPPTPLPKDQSANLDAATADGGQVLAPRHRPQSRLTGTCMGPYEIGRRLGTGGMGEVWVAQDLRLNRTVALKLLPAGLAGSSDYRQRFLREARLAAAVAHPFITAIYDIGEHDAVPWIAMEFVQGQTLRQILTAGKVTATQAAAWGAQIAQALEHAHNLGVVHRDLKPENVMIDAANRVKVLDFGLARRWQLPPDVPAASGGEFVTIGGQLLGTPGYMAPEQARGEPVDFRADLFALGAVLYELIAGCRAFPSDTPLDGLLAVAKDTPAPLQQFDPTVPPTLTALIVACLSKAPADRPDSAATVAALLAAQSTTASEPLLASPVDKQSAAPPALSPQPPASLRGNQAMWRIGVAVAVAAAAIWMLARPSPQADHVATSARLVQVTRQEVAGLQAQGQSVAAQAEAKATLSALTHAAAPELAARVAMAQAQALVAEGHRVAGRAGEAEAAYRAALQAVAVGQARDWTDAQAAAASESALGLARTIARSRPAEALAVCEEALAAARQSPWVAALGGRARLAQALKCKGIALLALLRNTEALAELAQALAAWKAIEMDHPGDNQAHEEVAKALNNVAVALEALGNPDQALQWYQADLAAAVSASAAAPANLDLKHNAAMSAMNVADALFARPGPEAPSAALAHLDTALGQLEAIVAADSARQDWRRALARCLSRKADVVEARPGPLAAREAHALFVRAGAEFALVLAAQDRSAASASDAIADVRENAQNLARLQARLAVAGHAAGKPR